MKITKIDQPHVSDRIRNPSISNIADGNFSLYLDEILLQHDKENVVDSVYGTSSLDLPDDPVDNITSSETTGNSVMERVKAAMDQLDAFAKILGSIDFDPVKTDQTVKEMIQKLLYDREESSSTAEDVLKELREEVKMCSFLESIKWRRGDYL
jgi:hypothetical protein